MAARRTPENGERPDQPKRRLPQQQRSIETQQRLLDAAVEGLIDVGYPNLTTVLVSERAAASRGAQQHHFPHKATLVSTAVMQLHERNLEQIRAKAGRLRSSKTRRVEQVLDLFWDSYTTNLFTATLSLALESLHDEDLAEAVAEAQRLQDASVLELCKEVFPERVIARADSTERLAHALATIRGLAILRHMQTPPEVLERHWHFARPVLAALLVGEEQSTLDAKG